MLPPKKDYDLLVIGECFVEFSCEGDAVKCDYFKKDIKYATPSPLITAAVVLIFSALTFFPAIALGPVAEYLTLGR